MGLEVYNQLDIALRGQGRLAPKGVSGRWAVWNKKLSPLMQRRFEIFFGPKDIEGGDRNEVGAVRTVKKLETEVRNRTCHRQDATHC